MAPDDAVPRQCVRSGRRVGPARRFPFFQRLPRRSSTSSYEPSRFRSRTLTRRFECAEAVCPLAPPDSPHPAQGPVPLRRVQPCSPSVLSSGRFHDRSSSRLIGHTLLLFCVVSRRYAGLSQVEPVFSCVAGGLVPSTVRACLAWCSLQLLSSPWALHCPRRDRQREDPRPRS